MSGDRPFFQGQPAKQSLRRCTAAEGQIAVVQQRALCRLCPLPNEGSTLTENE